MANRYTDQHPQFSDSNGSPLANGEIEFFDEGTTGSVNRKKTFSDKALTTANPNPIALDGNGRSVNPIFLGAGFYNTIIRDRNGVQIDQVDSVTALEINVFDTIALAQAVADDMADGLEIYVKGYATINDGGGGHFIKNNSRNRTEGDGGKIIDPSQTLDLQRQETASRTPSTSSGTGTLDRTDVNQQVYRAAEYGAINGRSVDNSLALAACSEACPTFGTIELPAMEIRVQRTNWTDIEYDAGVGFSRVAIMQFFDKSQITIRGAGKQVTRIRVDHDRDAFLYCGDGDGGPDFFRGFHIHDFAVIDDSSTTNYPEFGVVYDGSPEGILENMLIANCGTIASCRWNRSFSSNIRNNVFIGDEGSTQRDIFGNLPTFNVALSFGIEMHATVVEGNRIRRGSPCLLMEGGDCITIGPDNSIESGSNGPNNYQIMISGGSVLSTLTVQDNYFEGPSAATIFYNGAGGATALNVVSHTYRGNFFNTDADRAIELSAVTNVESMLIEGNNLDGENALFTWIDGTITNLGRIVIRDNLINGAVLDSTHPYGLPLAALTSDKFKLARISIDDAYSAGNVTEAAQWYQLAQQGNNLIKANGVALDAGVTFRESAEFPAGMRGRLLEHTSGSNQRYGWFSSETASTEGYIDFDNDMRSRYITVALYLSESTVSVGNATTGSVNFRIQDGVQNFAYSFAQDTILTTSTNYLYFRIDDAATKLDIFWEINAANSDPLVLRPVVRYGVYDDIDLEQWDDSTLDTDTNLDSLTSDINTIGKFQGREVMNSGTNEFIRATGSSAASVWVFSDGTTSNTPV